MQEVLVSEKLAVGYKNRKVVQNINFELRQGDFCAIVGVNGIGKSTLLRTLANLQPSLGGHIKINQISLKEYPYSKLAREIALVLTEPVATKNLTVHELVALGRQPYTNWLGNLTENDKSQIALSLKTFQLESLQSRKCFELSDGQLQRVLIAKAMAQDTPIILLDEPTTHLDLSHKVQIFKMLQKLAHKHQKTVLFTTHEIDLAIQLCDKILILDGADNPFGEPCELIEKGSFSNLFPSEMVEFDIKTGSFKVKK
ncbi:MAG: ABC transporter ATP-binding protein [Bacteroidota bacterium]